MNLLTSFRILIIFMLGGIFSCMESTTSLVNTSHLDHLYEEITFKGIPSAIIHIYADYPSYNWTEAPGEGIACIDDITRAAVFYLRYGQLMNNAESLRKSKLLTNFVLEMQADNGYFYNFIDENYKIDSTIQNSRPVGNWWSWRSLWALGEAYPYYVVSDAEYAKKIQQSIKKILMSMKELNEKYLSFRLIDEMQIPRWLPLEGAADQAAVALLGLIPYFRQSEDSLSRTYIEILSDGIIYMLKGDSISFPYGAFMSWEADWHAYGNSQSDAILQAGLMLYKENYLKAAFIEIDFFYDFLIKQNYLKWFRLTQAQDGFQISEQHQFEQIAYGIRPMVMACLQAYEVSGDKSYVIKAADIAKWLLGKNISGQMIYDPETGRCFDGINSVYQVNKNSGAESTIEALITLLAVEQNPISRKIIFEYYSSQKN